MTISSETRKAGPFTGNGVTATFPFTFKVFQASDVKVVRANTAAVETILTMGTDYTISLNANQDSTPGGSITLTSPLTLNYLLSATSKVPNTQTMDLTNQGGFYPKVINAAMDRLTVQLQQVALDAANAVKVPLTSTQTGDQLRDSLILAQANTAASAAAAATSATNALTSETNAASSASAALTSKNAAATSATNAATSATNSANSATSASTSAGTATTQASNASTSASTATTQASNASTSASNASTSATNAANSATAAAGSAASAANSYTTFNNQYLGGKASDPTLNNTGGALVAGNLYFNTTSSVMRTYSGTAWADVAQGVSTPYQTFSGTGAQTAFTLSSTPGSLGSLEVFVHGVRQTPTTDYTISGTTLTFVAAPTAGAANIFVRWISTQAINVPADASVTPAKLANSGNELGMRNRIINGAGIVRQRGPVALAAGLQYGQADRMMASVAGATGISGNITAGSLSGASTGQGWGIGPASWTAGTFQLAQRIESYNVSDLSGKTVTFSGKLYHDIGSTRTVRIIVQKATAGVDNFSSTATISETTVSIPSGVTTPFTYKLTLGASDATNGLMVIALDNAAVTVTSKTVYASDWQLEPGPTATPFEFRPYGTELALCQRYYELGPSSVAVYAQSTTAGKFIAQYQVPKRAIASVSPWSTQNYLQQNMSAAFASGSNALFGTMTFTLYAGASSTQGFSVDYSNTTALTQGTGFDYAWNNLNLPFWVASAEL